MIAQTLLALHILAAPPELLCTEQYHRPGKFLANPDESVLIAGVIGWCRREKKRLLWDENYAAVARQWSEWLVKDPPPADRPIGAERLIFELQRQGVSDALVIPFSVAGTAEKFPEEIAEFLDERAGNGRFTHFGVGVGRFPDQKSMMSTIIIGRRPAVISPLPRCPQVGDRIELALQLMEGFSHPTWLMTVPDGSVQKDLLKLDSGLWRGGLLVDFGRGNYRLEIMVQGPAGPEVAAWMPLYVGVEPPPAPVVVLRNQKTRYESVAQAEKALADMINQERLRHGLGPLVLDQKLSAAARRHALAVLEEQRAAHHHQQTGQLTDRLRREKISFARALENVALAASIEEAHQKLLDSPAHRLNIFDPDVSRLGVGLAMEQSTRGDQVAVCEIFIEGLTDPASRQTAQKILTLVNEHRLKKGRFKLSWDEELAREAQRCARRLASLGDEADVAGQTEELYQRLGQLDPPLVNYTVRAYRTTNPSRLLQEPEVLDEQINRLGAGMWSAGGGMMWLVAILAGR